MTLSLKSARSAQGLLYYLPDVESTSLTVILRVIFRPRRRRIAINRRSGIGALNKRAPAPLARRNISRPVSRRILVRPLSPNVPLARLIVPRPFTQLRFRHRHFSLPYFALRTRHSCDQSEPYRP